MTYYYILKKISKKVAIYGEFTYILIIIFLISCCVAILDDCLVVMEL